MTPWFNKYMRPHWVGVYATRVNENDHEPQFNYWNGTYWEAATLVAKRRDVDFLRPVAYVQHLEWRGFTKEKK